MKITKKALSVLLAFTLVIGLFLAPTEVAKAATNYGAVPAKVRIYTESSYQTFSFDLPSYGCSIANLKANSNKIKVKQTTNYSRFYQDDTETENTNYATIALYTQKEGTYTVTFDIVDANSAVVSSNVVKVYARNDSPLKSVKLGKNTVSLDTTTTTTKSGTDNYLLKGNSGKLQVKMAKGYKMSKIEYGIYDKEKDEVVYTQVGNKAKINYGTVVDESSSTHDYTYQYSNYTYINKYSYWRKPAIAYTYIRVTYTDKYTKAEDTRTVSFYQWVQ